ncbi:MAG: hypothetical protein HYY52_04020 [Candidatus Melainabacteria bacterium]|nr:hypothetical protein [Candidatus Melainabacteria bacterium]
MFRIKELLLILSVGLLLFNVQPCNALGKNQDTHKWLESLRLKDFYMLPSFLEIKEKSKDYKNNLSTQYQNTPDVFSVAVEYGLLLIDLGIIERARTVFEKAQGDFVGNPTPKVYRALVDAYQGKYESAKSTWYPILKERYDMLLGGQYLGMWLPHHVDAIVSLYLIKDNFPEKDKLEIEKMTLEVAKLFGKNPKFAAILASKDLQEGKLDSAKGRLGKVLDQHPDEPLLITLLGITNLLSENYNEALKLFDKTNEIYPKFPTNNIMKARALYALKRKEEANKAIELARKYDPILEESDIKLNKMLAFKTYSKKIKAKENSGTF